MVNGEKVKEMETTEKESYLLDVDKEVKETHTTEQDSLPLPIAPPLTGASSFFAGPVYGPVSAPTFTTCYSLFGEDALVFPPSLLPPVPPSSDPPSPSTVRSSDPPLSPPARPPFPPARPLSPFALPWSPPARPLSAPARPWSPPTRPLSAPARPWSPPTRPLSAPARPWSPPAPTLSPLVRPAHASVYQQDVYVSEGSQQDGPIEPEVTTKACSKLSCANGKRLEAALMVIVASLLMALANYVQSPVTLAIRQRSVKRFFLVILAPTVIAVNSSTDEEKLLLPLRLA